MRSSTNLFPQRNVGVILVSLALYTVGQVVRHAVVERVRVHKDFVQLIQKPSLQTLFLFVFFDLESRRILHRVKRREQLLVRGEENRRSL